MRMLIYPVRAYFFDSVKSWFAVSNDFPSDRCCSHLKISEAFGDRGAWGHAGVRASRAIFKVPSEIMNYFGRKGDPQGVQHGQNVDDFLGDGTAHRT